MFSVERKVAEKPAALTVERGVEGKPAASIQLIVPSVHVVLASVFPSFVLLCYAQACSILFVATFRART